MHISAVTAAVVEDSVAKRFWNKSQDESLLPLYTPFMFSLIAGSLELDTFRRYIAQDVHFLKAFAQSYEMAEDCADDDDAKTAIFELRKNVMKELKMHNSVLEVQEEVQAGLSRYVFSASSPVFDKIQASAAVRCLLQDVA